MYTISDQDDSGAWIRRSFPSIFYICSPGNFDKATWTGFSTDWPGADPETISREWLARNIQQGHGPLGAVYPDIAYGLEGDTPSFLSLIPNGLNDPEHPNYGGWGGRYELYTPKFEDENWQPSYSYTVRPVPESRPLWTNAVDSYTPPDGSRPPVRLASSRRYTSPSRPRSGGGATRFRMILPHGCAGQASHFHSATIRRSWF